MSDEIEIGQPGQRRVVQRGAPVRTAEERTAADVGGVGVGSDPSAATAAMPAREVSMPEVVTRRRREDRQTGSFNLPDHLKKPGWDYQFMAIRVLNQPVDSSELRDFCDSGGWRAEKARDWPTLVEPGTPDDAPIEMYGQRLYGRPLSLTMEARQEDLEYAQRQQRDKMIAAASGKSAVRGEEGIPTGRAVRTVPIEISLEGRAG